MDVAVRNPQTLATGSRYSVLRGGTVLIIRCMSLTLLERKSDSIHSPLAPDGVRRMETPARHVCRSGSAEEFDAERAD